MYEFKVDGMTCMKCVSFITKTIQAADPGAEVSADLAQKKVRVNSKESPQEIAALIEEAGYQATLSG